MNETKRIVDLIEKHLNDELSNDEMQELDTWKEQSESHRRIFDELTNNDYLYNVVSSGYPDDGMEKIWNRIEQATAGDAKIVTYQRFTWRRLIAAAAVLIMLTGSIYIFWNYQKPKESAVVKTPIQQQDIAPGTYKATLKLADGRSIVLDSAAVGQLAQQGSTQIMNKDGQLVYAPSGGGGKGEVLWNTLSTAKGQTYPLLLADNSRVWLNAESSIRFPVAFSGSDRKVEITGEVYFEVAHDAAKPFTVSVNGVDVRVLGTRFNVDAYEEVMKTTLIEGAVRVSNGIQKKQIRPGQQAQVIANEIKVADDVDIDQVVAWKNGLFQFNDDDLKSVMRQISRWYDVEVVYSGNVPDRTFGGKIWRNTNLSQVLVLLEKNQIHCRIEGRKIIVSP